MACARSCWRVSAPLPPDTRRAASSSTNSSRRVEITVEQGKALNTELKRKVSETVEDAKKAAAAEAGDKAAAAADTSAADKPADEGKAE